MKRKKLGSKSRRGTATVEMAFVAPFVFFLIFGSIEFSRMMMVRQAVTNAARDGCRNACLITTTNVLESDQTIRDALAGVIADRTNPATLRVVFTPNFVTAPPSGTEVTAHVEIDCADVSWLPPTFFAGLRISGRATMVRE